MFVVGIFVERILVARQITQRRTGRLIADRTQHATHRLDDSAGQTAETATDTAAATDTAPASEIAAAPNTAGTAGDSTGVDQR
jgi:hypothetical protein